MCKIPQNAHDMERYINIQSIVVSIILIFSR